MHGSSGVLLLSTVGGYLVLERAAKQRGSLKLIGRVVGWIVILLSILGVACQVLCAASGSCDMRPGIKRGQCPFMGHPVPDAPAAK